MRLGEALRKGARYLKDHRIPNPRLDAELMLASTLGRARTFVLAHPEAELTPAQEARFRSWLARRAEHYPLQYLRGVQEFYGREFLVTPDVLIPRPETELLVETALELAAGMRGDTLQVCDVGTGSGCIAITLALEDPRIGVVAIDLSGRALQVARRNAGRLECDSVAFLHCDVLTGLRSRPRFDFLISNPPYVSRKDRGVLDPAVERHEPHQALFAGDDGLAFYKKLFDQAGRVLRPGAPLILEVGYGLRDEVAALARGTGWSCQAVHDDLAGIPRCAVFEAP